MDKERELEIIKCYLSGYSLKKVAQIYNYKSPNSIKNILLKIIYYMKEQLYI